MTLDAALAQLAQSDAVLRETVAPLSPAQWNWKPAADTWSIAEGVEHLVLVERGILSRLRIAPADGFEKTEGKERLLVLLPRRERRLAAPDRLLPHGDYPHPAAGLAALAEARAATLSWAQDPGTNLLAHVLVHMAFGELHGLQWLQMIAGHTLRHVQQMREVMALPGYPAASSD